MRFNINIDQRFCLEWGLNLTEGAVFDILYNLSSWADPIVINGHVFYHASRNKIMEELPMLTDRPDTIYRIFRHLADESRALIQYEKEGRMDLIRLTERGKKWNSEKNPSLVDNSENFPTELGKKSENTSENFPTDNNTSIISTTSNNSLPTREEKPFENPNPIVWGDGTEVRLQKAQATLKAYFEKFPGRWKEIADQARNECGETQFFDELNAWIRRHAGNLMITQDPVKALTSGQNLFISWLSKPWCREQYKTNGNDSPTQRNGRVQQQRKIEAFPTTEELKRKYGVL